MTDLNKGEIGAIIYIDAGEDISTATEIKILLEPELGTIKEFTGVLGTSNITVDDITYAANEYATYTTVAKTDLDYVGRWRKKTKHTFSSTNVKQSNYQKFRVLA